MMMKKPTFLVACILLFSSLSVLASANSFGPERCCFDFYPRRLPKDKVASYKYTDERCAKEAVLFTILKGAVFCVDPSEEWVQRIINSKEWVNTKPMNGSELNECVFNAG